MKTNYSQQDFGTDMAKAYRRDSPISTKAAVSIANTIRGMDTQRAITHLDQVIAKRQAIAYTRFTDGVGHRRGPMAAGRFPVKAAKEFKAIIESVVANAANQGLADELRIVHLVAHKAASPLHQGRQRRREMKRTHIEIAVKEEAAKAAPVKKSSGKNEKKAEPAKEAAQ